MLGSSRGVEVNVVVNTSQSAIVNVLDSDVIVHVFKQDSRYYIHFRTYALQKAMNLFTPTPAMD